MYDVKTIALDAIKAEDQTIIEPGRRVSEFFVLDMPTGAKFSLRVGQSNPLITVTRPLTMEPQGDQESNSGIYWRNDTAQAGVSVQVVIVFGGDQLNPILT